MVLRLFHRYLLRQISAPLPAVLALLLLGMGLLQAERLGPLVLSVAAAPGEVARLVVAILPLLAVAALPGALLVSVLAGLGRMDDDGELEALRAGGYGPLAIAVAPAALAVAGALVAVAAGIWAEPLCRAEARLAARALARAAAERALRSEEIVEVVAGVSVHARAAGAGFTDVVLHDSRDGADRWVVAAGMSVAAHGEWLRLRLEDGEVHEADGSGGVVRLRFGGLETSIALAEPIERRAGWVRELEGLGPAALVAEAARREAAAGPAAAVGVRFFLWQKWALALACLAFVALGTVLGTGGGVRGAGRLRAFAVGIGATALYYGLGRGGEALAHAGALPAWAGAILAPVAIGIVVVALAARRR